MRQAQQNASAGAGVIDDVAELRPAGIIQRTAGRFSPNLADDVAALAKFKNAAGAARSTLPGWLGKGGVRGGLATAALGYGTSALADQLFEADTENNAAEFGRGFVKGAGWAPLAAPVIGAIPGVNAVGLPLLAAAAGVTGTIGGLADMFMGGGEEDSKDNKKTFENTVKGINKVLADRGASPEVIDLINNQFEGQRYAIDAFDGDEITTTDAEGNEVKVSKADAYKNLTSMMHDTVAQYIMDPQAFVEETGLNGNTKILQLQAAIGQTIEPYAAKEEQTGQNMGQVYIDKGMQIGGPEGEQLIMQGKQMQAASSSLANAYRMQAQLIPMSQKLDAYNSFMNQAAQVQQSQQIASMYGNGGGSDSAVDEALAAFG